MTAKPLKAGIGVRYLAPMVLCYMGLVLLLVAPEQLTWTSGLQHASIAGLMGLVVLALQELPTRAVKEIIVHWRIRDRLPGARAFTYFAPRDNRIDLNVLHKVLDPVPATPREQNVVWYGWLKQTEDAVEVADAHRRYLILRDAAVVSLLLALAALPLLALPGWSVFDAALLFAVCLAIYLVLALSARSVASRLVTTVIAIKLARASVGKDPKHGEIERQPAKRKRNR